jgi:hypothetical protein
MSACGNALLKLGKPVQRHVDLLVRRAGRRLCFRHHHDEAFAVRCDVVRPCAAVHDPLNRQRSRVDEPKALGRVDTNVQDLTAGTYGLEKQLFPIG